MAGDERNARVSRRLGRLSQHAQKGVRPRRVRHLTRRVQEAYWSSLLHAQRRATKRAPSLREAVANAAAKEAEANKGEESAPPPTASGPSNSKAT